VHRYPTVETIKQKEIKQYLNVDSFVRLVLASPDGSRQGDAPVHDLVRPGRALHRVAEARVCQPVFASFGRLSLRSELAVMVFRREKGRVHLLRADDVDGFRVTENEHFYKEM